MNGTRKLPFRSNADTLILMVAAISVGVLALLSVSHSFWMLAVLAPLPVIWYLLMEQARTSVNGAAQLRLAVTAVLAQHDSTMSRLQLVPAPTE